MAELNVVALIPAKPGSALGAADGHLAGGAALHPLRPV
jgi:hypothetical protein